MFLTLRKSDSIVSVVAGLLLAVFVLPAYADDPQTNSPATPPASVAASARHHHPHKKPDPPPLVLPPLPAGPLSQVPMDQLPEIAPKVTYEKGKLSIVAQNATLAEILKQVRKLTGASIDIPASATERVVAQIGPGAPRDVLATLLNGTAFNYVMLGSNTDPSSVASVMLTPKPGSAEAQSQIAANSAQQNAPASPMGGPMVPQPFRQQMIAGAQQPPNPEAGTPEDENTGAEATDDDENAEEAQPADQQPTPTQPNAGPRTPEQLLQMMRQGQPGMIQPPQPPQQ